MLHPLTPKGSNSWRKKDWAGGSRYPDALEQGVSPDQWVSSIFMGMNITSSTLHRSLTCGQTMLKVFDCVSTGERENRKRGVYESQAPSPEVMLKIFNGTLVLIWHRHYLGEGSGRAEREVGISFLP